MLIYQQRLMRNDEPCSRLKHQNQSYQERLFVKFFTQIKMKHFLYWTGFALRQWLKRKIK